jgi:hypothetical protein
MADKNKNISIAMSYNATRLNVKNSIIIIYETDIDANENIKLKAITIKIEIDKGYVTTEKPKLFINVNIKTPIKNFISQNIIFSFDL